MNSEDKFINIQSQMRENQRELQDYLKDMESWEEDIKKKDESLKNTKNKDIGEKDLPPIRNSGDIKKKKKKKDKEEKPVNTSDAKKAKIKAYDFRAWDKFDVEAACAEVDNVDTTKNSSSESEYETDEEWEIQRKKQQAVMEKDRGNQFFKEGKYNEAIECYTRGADCDPTNVLLPANRAMALLKQKKYAAAEVDCTTAISLDPTYVKAYSRRAAARTSLNKLTEAKADYERILKLEPENKMSQAEIHRINKILSPPTDPDLEKEEDKVLESGVVRAIYKAPSERSKKPLRRIEIEEIGGDDDADRKQAALVEAKKMQSMTSQKTAQKDAQMFDQLVANGDMKKTTEEKTRSKPKRRIQIEEVSEDESEDEGLPQTVLETNVKGASSQKALEQDAKKFNQFLSNGHVEKDKPSDEAIVVDSVSKKHVENDNSKTKLADKATKKLISGDSCNATQQNKSSDVSPRLAAIPVTSYQFQADCKEFKHDPEKFFQYFKKIPAKSLPKLFGQSLDADILLKIMHTLKDYFILNGIDIVPVLTEIAEVKRFSMTVMFLSSKDKAVIKGLFNQLEQAEKHEQRTLQQLKAKYDL